MEFAGLSSPSELRGKSLPALVALAEDLRQAILAACLKNGGHLGASLGAVELAIALHYVFDSPREPIVWDVGHQAYAHKLLTGRAGRFGTLRMADGISGFLSRAESPHDVFGAGHSSTALSAALGIAWRGRDAWTAAVVGDGGLTAGLAFEALNNMSTEGIGAPADRAQRQSDVDLRQCRAAYRGSFRRDGAQEFFELFGLDYRRARRWA